MQPIKGTPFDLSISKIVFMQAVGFYYSQKTVSGRKSGCGK